MKFEKILIIGLFISICMPNFIFSIVKPTDRIDASETLKFELYNKSGKKIMVAVIGTRGPKIGGQLLNSTDNKKLQLMYFNDTNIKDSIFIKIYETGSQATSPNYYKIDPNSQRSKVYVSFGPRGGQNDVLYPQTGTFMGLSGKTDSGLSLRGNVKSTDISKIASGKYQEYLDQMY